MKGKFDSLINDIRPVVVDFHALWCSPCKMQSPILKEIVTFLKTVSRFGDSRVWSVKTNCTTY